MNDIPRLELNSLIPRRLFVSLEMTQGDEARKLWDKSRKKNVVVYFKSVVNSDDKSVTETVASETVATNGRLDASSWISNLTAWRVKNSGAAVESEPLPGNQVLDIALGLGGSQNLGFFLSWYPGGSHFRQLIIRSGDSRLLHEAAKSSDEEHVDLKASYWTATGGEPFLLLDIPEIAVCPESMDEAVDGVPRKRFPGDGVFDGLRRMVQPSTDLRWRFRPRPLHVTAKKLITSDVGFGMAIDFGTSASTVALFPMRSPHAPGAASTVDPLADILPWTHVTLVTARDNDPKASTTTYVKKQFDPSSFIDGEIPTFPYFFAGRRTLASADRASVRTQVPSLIHVPDFKHESRLDKELIVNDSPQCIIGTEAKLMIDQAVSTSRGGDSTVAWDRYLYGPKSLIGRNESRVPVREHLGACEIETYLKELFDQAFFTAINNEWAVRSVRPPLHWISYSYPVAWTDYQRRRLHEILKNSLQKSLLSECLPDGDCNRVLSSNENSMDEASAAFLGFIMKRFGGLEGEQLLRTYQPFDPHAAVEGKPLKPVNVLVFDCGEGTTDVVWLEIKEIVSDTSVHHVDSNVRRHFATEKAGLEVTRRIAELIKESIIRKNAGLSPEWAQTRLRSRLHDTHENVDDYCHILKQKRSTYRLGLIHTLYNIAEEIKIHGAVRDKLLPSRLKEMTEMKEEPELNMPADVLKSIVRDVFAVVIEQVGSWFKDGAKLDAVIMSGRSSQLPELAVMLREAIPAKQRPYAMDFVTPGSFRLDAPSSDDGQDDQISKNVVVTGLALNLFNMKAMAGKSLRCNPIDSMTRTRSIGVMQEALGRIKPYFDPMFKLIVKPDNGRIDPNEELGPIETGKGSTLGFSLGINFAGMAESEQHKVDSPQEFLRVVVQNGNAESFDKLSFYFNQSSATDVRLSRVELRRPNGDVVSKSILKEDSFKPIQIGSIKVLCKPYSADIDFRNSGKIHIGSPRAVDL